MELQQPVQVCLLPRSTPRYGPSAEVLDRINLRDLRLPRDAAKGACGGLPTWIALRFIAGTLSACALVVSSAWALQHLTQAASSSLSGIVYAGVGLGIARPTLFRAGQTRCFDGRGSSAPTAGLSDERRRGG